VQLFVLEEPLNKASSLPFNPAQHLCTFFS
jgi:hypothetical protein